MVSRVMEEVQNEGVLVAPGVVAQGVLVAPLLLLHLELRLRLIQAEAEAVVQQMGWLLRTTDIKAATAVLES